MAGKDAFQESLGFVRSPSELELRKLELVGQPNNGRKIGWRIWIQSLGYCSFE
jgi:hypothetical protein